MAVWGYTHVCILFLLEVQGIRADLSQRRLWRKLGEVLAGMSMNTGELYRGNMMSPRGNEPTLADIGISKMQSSRWQLGAELDEDVFEGYLAKQWGDGNEITSADILRLARRQMQELQFQQGE